MAAFDEYPQLTKVDKSRAISLKQAIFEGSWKLGSGVSYPVPYDTAWVGRIPEINEAKPAFPETLQWLRLHQAEDGTWGAKYPVSIHSQMLNTFSAVLAFAQWNYEDDKEIIKKGTKALETIAKALPQEETYDNTFEIIMSSFLDDARAFELDLAYEQFEWYPKIGQQKLKSIEREILSNKPNKYWGLLEAAGSMDLEIESYRNEIFRYGLIAAQPSTTAFLLRYARLRGEDFPESEWVFKKLCAQNQGGIPHLISVDNFEIINGLDFLFKVDINPRLNSKHGATQMAIDTLKRRFDSASGIGFSSHWPVPDVGCTEVALRVARQISGKIGNLSNGVETKMIKHEPFQTAQDFDFSNLSKNHSSFFKSNSMHHQAIFQDSQRNFGKALNFPNKSVMQCMQNVSSYYTLLQYAFTTPKFASEIFTEVEKIIGKNQNHDGGWGDKNISSAEETAYVCLIIYRLVQTKKGVLDSIDFPKLVKFINTVDSPPTNESFWCYKVTFGSAVLTETIITAAKYGIFQIQRLCMFTDAVNDNQLDFMDIGFWDKNNQFVYRGYIPLTSPEPRMEDIEVSKTELDEVCKSILQSENIDKYLQDLFDYCLYFSYLQNDYKMPPFERAMDSLIIVFLFFFTDFIDFYLEKKERTTEFDDSMKTACDILRGKYHNCESVPTFTLPRLPTAWRFWFHLKKTIEKYNWDPRSWVETFEEGVFKSYSIAYRLRCFGIELTAKRYLELAKHDVGLDELVRYSTLLQNNTVDLRDFKNDKLLQKYKDSAKKAGRCFSDIPSVFRDVSFSHSDNYCLALMQEYGLSLPEAMMKACKKMGKEIMKMYSLKKMILARGSQNTEKLMHLIGNMERYVHGCGRVATNALRYEAGQKCLTKRVNHEKKDFTFIWDLCYN